MLYMTYKSYNILSMDLEYSKGFSDDNLDKFFGRMSRFDNDSAYSEIINEKAIEKLRKIWIEHMKEKFEATKRADTAFGKFLKKYPMEFKEICCLLELINAGSGKFCFLEDDEDDKDENPFAKYKVRYESSQLKRFKLVYKIVNPLTPLKMVYQVSYKAQLALKNKKYTNEYEQLDMALEEDSKRNSPDALDSLYYVIEPKARFDDLIISDKIKESLKSAIARDEQKEKIFKKWGFKKVIEYGKGTTINFRGPPGTGKTLAANVVAKELGKKLLMVRYDQLQNMFVGVTEKHIQRVFKLASKKNAVLFFDEADAIALDRSTLEKSWEMSQVNTLLKELERFDGVCIFATNFAQKYDPAFERRLTMHIDFPMPDMAQCKKILNNLLPLKSREKNLSFDSLSLEDFSGGDLKNIALNAAGMAAKDNTEKISLEHVKEAISMARHSNTSKYDVSYLG